MLAALLALAATPVATAAEGQRLAQAQDRQPDATPGKATDAERVSPLRWLNYSSKRFRTLMRMLAARAARAEAKRAADAKAAAEEPKRVAETKAADDARRADETRRAAEAKAAAEEAKRVAEAKAADDARRADEARQAADAKAAAEEAKRVAEAKAADDARRADEARQAAEAKAAAEEARRAAQAEAAKRAADARKAPEIAQADKRPATDKPADAGKAAPAPEPRRRAPAACRNAGLKVAGAGWYVVQPGDSLWGIARVHYGYGRSYRRIHAANRHAIADPRRIYPCQRIYIPRARLGEAPLQALRVALGPFIRRRAMDAALPGLVD